MFKLFCSLVLGIGAMVVASMVMNATNFHFAFMGLSGGWIVGIGVMLVYLIKG